MQNREWKMIAADLWVLADTETGRVVARVEWPGFRLYRTGGQDYIDLESAKRAAEGSAIGAPPPLSTQTICRLPADGGDAWLNPLAVPDTGLWRTA